MTKTSLRTHYEERLNRVTAYIHDHLDDDLDLHKLADIACLSPHHWHRTYHALYGETLAATVKRLRLHRAAGYLAQTSMAIEQVAEKSGFGNVQSFTRIFSATYGMPPAQYRKNGSHTQFQPQRQTTMNTTYDIAIKTVPTTKVIAVEHIGGYMQIGKAFDTLYGWLGARQLITPGMRSAGIYFDDPTAVAEDELRSCACVITNENVTVELPLKSVEIAGGRYATLRHKGPYADMRAAYQWLYGVWLPQSGEEAANAPIFEEYLNNPRDTAPTELLTDIYLPLR
ncbi:MAG: GyrI-like domain-containing protein [Gammaproteobacteria bacterium]|nr:GyrI-like domain-containing protein [Gammaproteobacteria bacterium]